MAIVLESLTFHLPSGPMRVKVCKDAICQRRHGGNVRLVRDYDIHGLRLYRCLGCHGYASAEQIEAQLAAGAK